MTVYLFFQSSIASTNPATAPSFQSTAPYAPYSRAVGPSYTQFGGAAQQFGSAGAGGKDECLMGPVTKTTVLLVSLTKHV